MASTNFDEIFDVADDMSQPDPVDMSGADPDAGSGDFDAIFSTTEERIASEGERAIDSLEEFGTEAGNIALWGQNFGEGRRGQLLKNLGKQLFTFGGAARRDQIRGDFGELTVEDIGDDNALITNPQTGGQVVLNRKGLSQADITPILGGLVAFTPAGRAGVAAGRALQAAPTAARIAGRTAAGGTAAAATDVALQGAEGLMGSEQDFDPVRTGWAAGGGVLGEAVGMGVEGLINRGRASLPELRTAGTELARRLGYENLIDEDIVRLGQIELGAPDATTAENIAIQNEFGFNFRKGQMHDDIGQQSLESRMMGSQGTPAERAILELNQRSNRENIPVATQAAGERIVGRPVDSLATESDEIFGAVRDAEDVLKTRRNDAHSTFDAYSQYYPIIFNAGAFRGIMDDVQRRLGQGSGNVTGAQTPESIAALYDIQSHINPARGQSLDVIETEIRNINARIRDLRPGNQGDQNERRVLGAIRDSLRARVAREIDNGNYADNPGARATAEAWQQKTIADRDYYGHFGLANSEQQRRVNGILRGFIDDNANPGKVADWIYGAGNSGTGRDSIAVIRQLRRLFGGAAGRRPPNMAGRPGAGGAAGGGGRALTPEQQRAQYGPPETDGNLGLPEPQTGLVPMDAADANIPSLPDEPLGLPEPQPSWMERELGAIGEPTPDVPLVPGDMGTDLGHTRGAYPANPPDFPEFDPNAPRTGGASGAAPEDELTGTYRYEHTQRPIDPPPDPAEIPGPTLNAVPGNPQGFEAVRALYFRRLIEGAAGDTGEKLTPAAIERRLESAFRGRNRAVLEELFTTQEIASLQRLSRGLAMADRDLIRSGADHVTRTERFFRAVLATSAGRQLFGASGLGTLGPSISGMRTGRNTPATLAVLGGALLIPAAVRHGRGVVRARNVLHDPGRRIRPGSRVSTGGGTTAGATAGANAAED